MTRIKTSDYAGTAYDQSMDYHDSGGYGPLVPTETERSLMERVRQELKHELKQAKTYLWLISIESFLDYYSFLSKFSIYINSPRLSHLITKLSRVFIERQPFWKRTDYCFLEHK